jgi:uncharacterized protein
MNNSEEFVFSKHNILSRLKDSEEYFLINILSKNADIISGTRGEEYSKGIFKNAEELMRKGYLVIPEEEEKRYKNAYLDFLDLRDSAETQIFFAPTYGCNFSCTYCYQSGYENEAGVCSFEVIDAFFAYLDTHFQKNPYYLTLFGGEALLPGKRNMDIIGYFLDEARKREKDVAVVTNGYALKEYIDTLKRASIREIQVTLDGMEEIHNKRRPLLGGRGTFSEIINGIDAALEAGFSVNLRVVVDKGNIEELPKLAQFAREKGWIDNPLVKTQLGRNYELHSCQEGNNTLFSRLEMYESLYSLIKQNPEITRFHRPSFSVSKFLFENGELPEPLFDSCPGCTTEWAFDLNGDIYSCTATVGKKEEKIGSFYPDSGFDEELAEQWEERDVTAIPECGGCNLQLACGGGCAAVAKNKSGKILSPDCRPVKELLELGISAYFNEEE